MATYQELVNYAQSNNGKVLTQEITFLKKCRSIKFECEKGHHWEIVTQKALLSLWCPECNGSKNRKKITIEDMRKIAHERGGKCLSSKYVNISYKLEWECKEGHRWFADSNSVKNKKSWCKKCRNQSMKNTIEDMQFLASLKGGKCLSTEYVLNNVNLQWECHLGHQWSNQPANITMGEWCPVCRVENDKLTIEEMREIARSRGGKCLSESYTDIKTKLRWECDKGHQWMAQPVLVKHHKSWCPICAGNRKQTIEDMQKLAEKFGGEVLSKKYIASKEKLKWKCKNGHVFYKAPDKVKHRNSWCPDCPRTKKLFS